MRNLKKLVVALLCLSLLVVIASPVLANSDNVDEKPQLTAEPQPVFTTEELKEIFPEANISDVTPQFRTRSAQSNTADAMNPEKEPANTYEKRISNDEVYYLDVYDDGSYVSYGATGAASGGIGEGTVGSSYDDANVSFSNGNKYLYDRKIYWDNFAGNVFMSYLVDFHVNLSNGITTVDNIRMNYALFLQGQVLKILRPIQAGNLAAVARMGGTALDPISETGMCKLVLDSMYRYEMLTVKGTALGLYEDWPPIPNN
ncbi:hypothetical protein [Eubacterium limosum]|uniref:hypothetical protein n=1 Tax=Eubacterium limosum TaxID=1736 RepID=UPI00106308A5|nr:hypothetical protein [Eubacterium limosum]